MWIKFLTVLVLALVSVGACSALAPTPTVGPKPAITASPVTPSPTPSPVPSPSPSSEQPEPTRHVHRDSTLSEAEWFAIKQACLLWNDALGFRLFVPSEMTLALPWNRIVVVTAQEMGGTAYAFGYSFTAEKPGVVIINRSRPMPEERQGPVALHELGHVMGLNHSPVYDDIMYAYTHKQTLLTANDKERARALFTKLETL